MGLRLERAIAVALAGVVLVATVAGATTIVPGTADPWLAGMPAGSIASSGDVAPDQSPVLVSEPGIDLLLGGVLQFAATGSVGYCTGCTSATPDGDGGFYPHLDGAQNGIASGVYPANALMGVFLTDAQPDGFSAPAALDFSSIGLAFPTLSPELRQPFFIGDGLTGTGTGSVQSFLIPVGATRLFLGTGDGYGWYDNVGTLEVEITQSSVPEPATLVLFGSVLLALLGLRRSGANKPSVETWRIGPRPRARDAGPARRGEEGLP
jgi:hypothetical protein